MALLVLFSTFSFTVETHHCSGFLVDVSYFGEAVGCGMTMDASVKTEKKNCCKNEVHKIEGQEELQQSILYKFDFKKQQFLTSYIVSYCDLFISNESKEIIYKDFSPPDIPKNYLIEYQTFLI